VCVFPFFTCVLLAKMQLLQQKDDLIAVLRKSLAEAETDKNPKVQELLRKNDKFTEDLKKLTEELTLKDASFQAAHGKLFSCLFCVC
jgi:hypothetical protein